MTHECNLSVCGRFTTQSCTWTQTEVVLYIQMDLRPSIHTASEAVFCWEPCSAVACLTQRPAIYQGFAGCQLLWWLIMCSGHAVHMKVRHVTGASEAHTHKGEFITGKLQQGANVQYQELHQGKKMRKLIS